MRWERYGPSVGLLISAEHLPTSCALWSVQRCDKDLYQPVDKYLISSHTDLGCAGRQTDNISIDPSHRHMCVMCHLALTHVPCVLTDEPKSP